MVADSFETDAPGLTPPLTTEAQDDFIFRARVAKSLGMAVEDACNPVIAEIAQKYGLDAVQLEIASDSDIDTAIEIAEVIRNKTGGKAMTLENTSQEETQPFRNELDKEALAEALSRKFSLGDGGAEALMLLGGDNAGSLQRVAKAIASAREAAGESRQAEATPPQETVAERQRREVLGTGRWLPTQAEVEALTVEQYGRLRQSGWSGEVAPDPNALPAEAPPEEEGRPSAEEIEQMSMSEYNRWWNERQAKQSHDPQSW